MQFTEEQLRAIEDQGKNLLLSAAAGSGKTTVLVERVLRLIQRHGAQVDRMLIVTFTRAAAADMRAKLIRSLSQAAAQGDRRLAKQLRVLERASITTLHAFCSDFLRSNFEAAGVDPAFRVLDEGEARRLFAAAMDEAMEEAYRAGGEALLELDYGRGPAGVRALAEELYAFLQERPEPQQWLEDACACDDRHVELWIREMVGSTQRAVSEAIVYTRSALEEPLCPPKYDLALEKDLHALEEMQRLREYDPLQRTVSEFTQARASAGKGEAPEDALERIKRLRANARDVLKKAEILKYPLAQSLSDARAMCGQLRALAQICRRAEEIFAGRKAEISGMTYSDLEQYTLNALKDENSARTVRERYDYVFVDEYQDTSDVQEAIVSRIVRGDNLFMVGDVKQSIYRFRNAEPGFFLDKYRRYGREDGGRLIALTRNFRSRETVLAFVNLLFERLMVGGESEIEYDASARLNLGAEDEAGGRPVEIHLIDAADKGEPAEEDEEESILQEMKMAERECALIAGRMHAMMAEDPSLRFRDFAILTRNKAALAVMLPVLLAAGIPAYAENSAGYFDSMEVLLALEILKLVVNERSDVELIGVLRSGICGLSPDELAEIRIASPLTAYVDAARSYAQGEGETAEKVRGLFALLASLRLRMGSLGLGSLVRAAIEESGLYLYAGALPGGRQRQANLDLLVDNAAAFDRDISGSLARYLQHTENLRARGDGDAAHLLGENDDVVRLMSIHKSKGLEFKVVFGAMLHQKYKKPDGKRPFLAHGELGMGINIYDSRLRTRRSTLPWAAIAQREARQNAAEELRVLYVMLTRARERLVLTGTVRNAENAMRRWRALSGTLFAASSHLDCVMGALLAAEDQGIEPGVVLQMHGAAEFTPPDAPGQDNALAAFDEAIAHPEKYVDEALLQEMQWQYPDANAARRPMKLTVSGLLREIEGPEVVAPLAERPAFMAESQGMTGAERGNAYHRAMQLLRLEELRDLPDSAMQAAIREQLDAMDRAAMLRPGQRDAVRPWNLVRFLKSDIGKRLLHASDVRREWPFNVLMQAKDVLDAEESPALDGELIVQGVVDCCFLEDGEWVLLDYKTDRAENPMETAEKYRRQLGAYALALERITGIRVKEMWLCLLGAGMQILL